MKNKKETHDDVGIYPYEPHFTYRLERRMLLLTFLAGFVVGALCATGAFFFYQAQITD